MGILMWKGATFSWNNLVCWDRTLQVLQSEDRVQKSDTPWVIWPINNQSLCRGGIWIWLAALVFLCSGSAGAAGADGAAREQKYRSVLDFAIWRTQKTAPLRDWCCEWSQWSQWSSASDITTLRHWLQHQLWASLCTRTKSNFKVFPFFLSKRK